VRILRKLGSFVAWIVVLFLVTVIFATGAYVAFRAFRAYHENKSCCATITWEEMAQRGEFFGGHLGTVLSAATLALLVLTSFLQRRASNITEARAMFASAIDAISRYDTHEAGCAQALRLLDHYSALALNYGRREFYSLLNTVMTSRVRRTLRNKRCPYENAVKVRRLISLRTARDKLRRDHGFVRGSIRYYSGRFKKPSS
jgi:hypothetical protein